MTEQKRYNLIKRPSQRHFDLVHAFYAIMGGFAFYGPYCDNKFNAEESLFDISTDPCHPVEVPKLDTLIYIMKYFPHIITDVTEESILDRAASSSLSKALLIVQVAGFFPKCGSRLFQGLPISLLEVSTAAHAFCTLITYFVWWSKPINVASPTLLREKEAREVHALLKCSVDEYDKALAMSRKTVVPDSSTLTGTHESEKIILAANALQHLLPFPERPPLHSGFERHSHMLFPGSFGNKWASDTHAGLITTAISPILYGLLHLLAWTEHFPTPLEQLLWRISSFVVACSGLLGVSVLCILAFLDAPLSRFRLDFLIFSMTVFMISTVHVFASSFLIFESFRQLFFLDPPAYQIPSWSNYWPHLS